MLETADAEITFDLVAPLIPKLEQLHREYADTRRFLTDARLDQVLEWIGESDRAGARWYSVVRWVMEVPDRLERLLRQIELEHPDNAQVMATVRAIRAAQAASARAVPTELASQPPATTVEPPERVLIDRTDAVEILEARLLNVANGGGGALLLLGESGIGKTSLADRTAWRAAGMQMVVLRAQCVGATAEGLLPIRDALSAYRGQRLVSAMLAPGGSRLEPYVPFVQALLGVEEGGETSRPLGGSRPSNLYEGISQVLAGLAERSGLCLVIEDLTDADSHTVSFLEYLLLRGRPARVLTIVTVKRDLAQSGLLTSIDDWAVRRAIAQYEVPPLPAENAGELLAQLDGGQNLDPARIHEIYELAHGNPYFMQQLARDATEQREAGRAWSTLPRDLETVLLRRLTLVDRNTREFLDAASVALENTQRLDLVSHVAGIRSTKSTLRLLRKAVERQCLREDDQGGVWFAQELLRRAIYGRLGPNARTEFHSLAAERLEADGLFASAAYHYSRAGRTEASIRTALEGASRAEYAGALPTAVELLQLALDASPRDRSPIAMRLVAAYIALGQPADASSLLADLDGDAPDVRLLQAKLVFTQGNVDRALEETERVLPALESGQLDARVWLAGLYLYRGRFDLARRHAAEAIAASGDDQTMLARCEGIVGATRFFAGDIDGGESSYVAAASRLSAIPVERRDRFVYTTILGNLGQARQARRDWAGARRFHEEALASRRAISDARGALQSTHAIAETMIGSGSFDEARPLLDEAGEVAGRLGDTLELAKLDLTSAQLALATGAPRDATRLATQALDRFRERRVDFDTAHARFVLSASLRAAGQRRRSIEEAAAARSEAQAMGFGLLAELYPDLGFSYAEAITIAMSAAIAKKPSAELAAVLSADGDDPLDAVTRAAGSGPDASLVLALFAGWATQLDDADRRRTIAVTLADAGGGDAASRCRTAIVASCASWGLEGASPDLLLAIASEEASAVMGLHGRDDSLANAIGAMAAGRWAPQDAATSRDYLSRALGCFVGAEDASAAVAAADAVGDPVVEALVGGIVGAQLKPGAPSEPGVLTASDAGRLRRVAEAFAHLRLERHDG